MLAASNSKPVAINNWLKARLTDGKMQAVFWRKE
jgi:hypothetical protein